MNTRHRRRISRKAAEQLLDGATGLHRSHAKAPGGPDQLARVLAAAAAPGREHELAGEQMAVTAFQAGHLESVASYQRGQMIKSPLAKLLTAKVLAATLTVFAGGGVALAASTGTFSGPGPASQTPGPAVSTSAPAVGSVVAPSGSATPTVSGPASSADPLSSADPQSSAGAQSTSSPAASASPSTVPQTAAALCHALIADANGTSSQQLSQTAQVAALASGAAPKALSSNSEFAPLIGTAQSAAAVPDYCALLLDLPQLPQPSDLTQLPATMLAQLLTQLPTATLSQVLTSLPSSTLSAVLTELPSSTVTQLLNELPTSTVSQLLNELPASVLSGLSGLSGLSNSVASLLPGL